MNKIYHLSTCSTCQRIIKELNLNELGFEFQDIKTNTITPEQLEHMAEKSGSYESLFSRRAMKYKSMGLAAKNLTEDDYKNLILEEYTFLKRPVIIIGNEQFVGNSKKIIEAASKAL
ncbi:MAG: arsenate reductase family protein [Salibacteraceae bacterium]